VSNSNNSVLDQDQKPSIKERFMGSQGKDVPLDYFLYSCLEFEKMLHSQGADAPKYRWPNLSGVNLEGPAPAEFVDEPIDALIEDLVAWYIANNPELKAGRALDLEVLQTAVPAIVMMSRDINSIVKLKTGSSLPPYDSAVGGVWSTIDRTLQRAFPRHHTMFNRYLQWTHTADKPAEVDLSNRPPVGRFAPMPPRRGAPPSRGGGGGDRPPPPRGDTDGNRRNASGPGHGEGARGERIPDRGGDRGFDRGGPRGGHGGGGERGFGRGGPRGGHGGGQYGSGQGGGQGGPRGGGRFGDRPRGDRPPRNQEPSPHLEAEALAEVDKAVEQLKTNPSLEEVTLKPTNSFYRRIQHNKIADTGFFSFSVGEGQDRSIRVSRFNNRQD